MQKVRSAFWVRNTSADGDTGRRKHTFPLRPPECLFDTVEKSHSIGLNVVNESADLVPVDRVNESIYHVVMAFALTIKRK